jgi:hypothetical protein
MSIFIQIVLKGRGGLLIDADNQTASDVFKRLCNFRKFLGRDRWQHILLIDPSSDVLFSYDPFFTRLTGRRYYDWLAARVEFVGQILARQQGLEDFKDQLRRQRVLLDVLWMVGVRGRNGKHFGLGKGMDALQFGSHAWERMFNEVCDSLPIDVARNLWRLHHTPRAQVLKEIESTINILRSFLRGRVKDIVSGHAPSIDAAEIVRNRGVVLVMLGETPFISREQCDAIGAMLNNEFIEANWNHPDPFYIFIDEATQFLRADTANVLRKGRKHNCRMFLAVQGLDALKNRFVDLTDAVMGQCGLKLFGRQEWEADDIATHLLSKVVNTELNWRPMDRPDGHEVVTLVDTSIGRSSQSTWTAGESFVRTDGRSNSFTHGESDSFGHSQTASEGESEGTSENSGRSVSKSDGISGNEEYQNFTGNQSDGKTTSSGNTRGRNKSRARGTTGSHADNRSFGQSVNDQVARGNTGSHGGSSSETVTQTIKHSHLPRYRTEVYSGGLVDPVEAQLWRIKQLLSSLPNRHFVMSFADKPPVMFKAHTILDQEPWDLDRLMDWMHSQHPCFFIPGEVEKWSSPQTTKRSSNGSTTRKPSKKSPGTKGPHTGGSNGSGKKGSSS